ncbi:HAMP domain-containing sensor histidine kinase [Microbacterium sp. ET2]|uniref:sensor histidine kinase n=1 Tax=Microbacterium albipurpureum TaxID=3050384 RepID=UPI00259C9902|nr:HAMP domain-containing sensor histidine kinase [Microbacterium sp. ET2 (Ac-2212)]WJL96160.1 HAMP domain-containing sensor histidine kinase [Microbacterium sp. ET2 (Ac-2212)]
MTGVTVALLVVGLFAAGIGTAIFLRNSLIASLDTQVEALATTDSTDPLIDIGVEDGVLTARAIQGAPLADYFVAVYDRNGELLTTAGGRGGTQPQPAFPAKYPVADAQTNQLNIVTLLSRNGEAEFRATVAVSEYPGGGGVYSEMVALPVSSVNRTIANYIAIYGILAVIIIAVAAALTRFLVTLTFRSLGQVETTADAIAAGDFSQRMTDIEPKTTEVGRLKTAINAMLSRVDAAITQRDATVRQMRRFIGDASHELRTPLVTVRGYAELYRMGGISGDEATGQAMERIEKEAVRMGLLVEDLLALARLDERKDVAIAPVDLVPIARDAGLDARAASPQRTVTVLDATVHELRPAVTAEVDPGVAGTGRRGGSTPTAPIPRRGASLSRLRRRPRTAPDAPAAAADIAPPPAPTAAQATAASAVVVWGDENRIRQVVANLLGNARRFTPDDSPIELRVGVDQEANLGWIEVIDHGDGVPDQIKDKIFQRFWRADTSRTRETGGTGLGLSIVASIINALHGSVDVFDTPGGGATFRVGFPLAESRDAAEHLLLETQPLPRPPRE